ERHHASMSGELVLCGKKFYHKAARLRQFNVRIQRSSSGESILINEPVGRAFRVESQDAANRVMEAAPDQVSVTGLEVRTPIFLDEAEVAEKSDGWIVARPHLIYGIHELIKRAVSAFDTVLIHKRGKPQVLWKEIPLEVVHPNWKPL